MLKEAVYDLVVAAPHVPPDVKLTAAEFTIYRQGYDMALVMALRVMMSADDRFKLYIRTRRLEAAARKKAAQS